MQFQDGQLFQELLQALKRAPLALLTHPYRNCIYQEAQWCLAHKKDSQSVIERHLSMLRAHDYPPENGLAACGLIARRHHYPTLVTFSESWWNYYQLYSQRDQLSFNFVAWQNQLPFTALPQNIYQHPSLLILPHTTRS